MESSTKHAAETAEPKRREFNATGAVDYAHIQRLRSEIGEVFVRNLTGLVITLFDATGMYVMRVFACEPDLAYVRVPFSVEMMDGLPVDGLAGNGSVVGLPTISEGGLAPAIIVSKDVGEYLAKFPEKYPGAVIGIDPFNTWSYLSGSNALDQGTPNSTRAFKKYKAATTK